MTTEQNVKQLFQLIGQMWAELDEFAADLPDPAAEFRVRGYGALYQEPITKIASFVFQQAGLWDAVVAAAKSDDPNASLMQLAHAEPTEDLPAEKVYLLRIAWVVLMVNLDAIATFNSSMSELLAQVEQGNDLALFRAVYLDASVLHAQPAADRISSAAILNDRSFFDSLAKAITRTKPSRPKPHLDGVRVLMNVLEDAGELETISNQALAELAANKIGVLPNSCDSFSAVRDQRRKRDRERGGPKS